MASIRRYTSPTHVLIVEGVDLTSSDVYVAYKQGDQLLKFSGADIDMDFVDSNTEIRVYMPQEVTASFCVGESLEVQVNWLTDGERNATTIAKVTVTRNLLEEVIAE